MNILLINHYAGSLRHGMEFRPYYLAREWIKRGHTVTIVAASYSHVRAIQPNCRDSESRETIDGIEYCWLKNPPYQGNGLGRVRNMATFVARLLKRAGRIAEEFRPDAVIASSTYPLDIFPARAIAGRAEARLIFEVHDLWPLSPQVLGRIPKWHPFIVVMQAAENLAYRWADAVVSLLPAAKPHMVRHGMLPEKFVCIPNGVAPEDWEVATPLPGEHEEILQRLHTERRFIVGYAGAHGLANGLHTAIEAARMAAPPFHFVLVGDGPCKAALQQQVKLHEKANVTFLPPVPKGAVPSLLAHFDVLFLMWGKNPLYKYGISPNKLLDYMMAAKPIVHCVEAANDPVSEAECGVTVTPEDPISFLNALQRLAGMSEQARKEIGLKGRAYVLKHHRYDKLATEFLHVLGGGQVER